MVFCVVICPICSLNDLDRLRTVSSLSILCIVRSSWYTRIATSDSRLTFLRRSRHATADILLDQDGGSNLWHVASQGLARLYIKNGVDCFPDNARWKKFPQQRTVSVTESVAWLVKVN